MNWKRKLSSRKFWMAATGFVAPLVAAFGGSEELAVQITALIMSGVSVFAYIFSEGSIDKECEKQKDGGKK